MRDAGKTIFVVTHQALLLEGVADEFVWMQAGQIVDRTRRRFPQDSCAPEVRPMKLPLGRHPRDAEKRHSPGVALQRRAQLHAVFFAAGGRDLRLLFRSTGGRVAPHRRRVGLGRVSVRGRRRAQPDLGARTAQSGARRLSRVSCAGELRCSWRKRSAISSSSACWKR